MSRGDPLLGRSTVVPAQMLGNPPEGAAGKVPQGLDIRPLKMRQPGYEHLLFEWHPVKQVVFVIRLDVPKGEKPLAEPFAWCVVDSGQAWNAALIWMRGYKHGRAEKSLSPAEQLERSDYAELG